MCDTAVLDAAFLGAAVVGAAVMGAAVVSFAVVGAVALCATVYSIHAPLMSATVGATVDAAIVGVGEWHLCHCRDCRCG